MLSYRIGAVTSRRLPKDGFVTVSYLQVRWHTGVIPPTRNVGAHTHINTDALTTPGTTKVLPAEVVASDAPL